MPPECHQISADLASPFGMSSRQPECQHADHGDGQQPMQADRHAAQLRSIALIFHGIFFFRATQAVLSRQGTWLCLGFRRRWEHCYIRMAVINPVQHHR
jgi:hypothetical protein